MLLNRLKELIQENPLREEIDLQGAGLQVLDNNSIDLLGRFRNLKRLNLQDNFLQKMPPSMEMLKNLEELNLNGNPIQSIEQCVDALKTLGPNLRGLSINLYEEDQVDYLLRHLDQLEVLNGLRVERDALFNEESEEEQSEFEGQQQTEEQLPQPSHSSNTLAIGGAEESPSKAQFVQQQQYASSSYNNRGTSEHFTQERLYEEILNDSQDQISKFENRKESAYFGGKTESSLPPNSRQGQAALFGDLGRQVMQETVGVPEGGINDGPEDEVSRLLKINTYEEMKHEDYGKGPADTPQMNKPDEPHKDSGVINPDYLEQNGQTFPSRSIEQSPISPPKMPVQPEPLMHQQNRGLSNFDQEQVFNPQNQIQVGSYQVAASRANHSALPAEIPQAHQFEYNIADDEANHESPDRFAHGGTSNRLLPNEPCEETDRIDRVDCPVTKECRLPPRASDVTSLTQVIGHYNGSHNTTMGQCDPHVGGNHFSGQIAEQIQGLYPEEEVSGGVHASDKNSSRKQMVSETKGSNKFDKYSPVLQNRKNTNKRETSNSSINSKKRIMIPSNASGVSQKDFGPASIGNNRRGSSLSNTQNQRKQSDPLHAAAFKFSANTTNALAGGRGDLNKTMDVRVRSRSKSLSSQGPKSPSSQREKETYLKAAVKQKPSRGRSGNRASSHSRKSSDAYGHYQQQRQNSQPPPAQIQTNHGFQQRSSSQGAEVVEDLTTPQGVVEVGFQGAEQQNQAPQPMNPELQSFIQQEVEELEELNDLQVDEQKLTTSDLEQIAIVYDKIRHIFKQVQLCEVLNSKAYEQPEVGQPPYSERQVQYAVGLAQEQDLHLAQDFDSLLTSLMGGLNEDLDTLDRKQEQAMIYPGNVDSAKNFGNLRKSKVIETKMALLDLCYDKAKQFMEKAKKCESLQFSLYAKALSSIFQWLEKYRGQMSQKLLSIIAGQFDQVESQAIFQRQQQEEFQADSELKEIEIRELNLKIDQKEAEIARLTEKVIQLEEQATADVHKLHVKEESQTINNDDLNSSAQNPMNESTYSSQFKNAKKRKKRQGSHGPKSRYMSSGNKESSKRTTSNLCSGAVASVSITSPKLTSQVASGMVASVRGMKSGGQSLYKSVGGGKQQHQKIIPLKQLKEIITDTYSQKEKFDKKCRESQLPIETMEQFMYTYLNHKYGLKSLIIEWASTIITSVRTYLREDHDITLFAKILKNECDEDFRYIQMHVKEGFVAALKQILRDKHPLKKESEIVKMSQQIQATYLEEWQWKRLINKMYRREDSFLLHNKYNIIIAERLEKFENFMLEQPTRMNQDPNTAAFQLQKKIQTQMQILTDAPKSARKGPASTSRQRSHSKSKMRGNKENEGLSRRRLLFQEEFMKVVLDFQLQEHEKFLSQFNQLFKEVDTDHNGVIDEEQFRTLILDMNIAIQHPSDTEADIRKLLKIIDPYGNNHMTYSEVVQLLSNQLVPTQPSLDPSQDTAQFQDFNQRIQIGSAGVTSSEGLPLNKEESAVNSAVRSSSQNDLEMDKSGAVPNNENVNQTNFLSNAGQYNNLFYHPQTTPDEIMTGPEFQQQSNLQEPHSQDLNELNSQIKFVPILEKFYRQSSNYPSSKVAQRKTNEFNTLNHQHGNQESDQFGENPHHQPIAGQYDFSQDELSAMGGSSYPVRNYTDSKELARHSGQIPDEGLGNFIDLQQNQELIDENLDQLDPNLAILNRQESADRTPPHQMQTAVEDCEDMISSKQKQFSNRQMISQMNIGNVHEKKMFSQANLFGSGQLSHPQTEEYAQVYAGDQQQYSQQFIPQPQFQPAEAPEAPAPGGELRSDERESEFEIQVYQPEFDQLQQQQQQEAMYDLNFNIDSLQQMPQMPQLSNFRQ